MKHSPNTTERRYLKLMLGGSAALALLVLFGWGGSHYYAQFESKRLARNGTAYLSGGDLRQASLAARSGLQLDPASVPNLRLMAEISEASNDKNALNWRRRILELNPGSEDDAIALANSALRFGDTVTAEQCLEEMARNGKRSARFHAAAAKLAEIRNDAGKSEEHWEEAVRLDPNEPSFQLDLALTRLHAEDDTKRAGALTILKDLRTNNATRLRATRGLIVDGISRHRDPETLAQLGRELQDYPEALLSDRLLYAEILHQTQPAEFARYLTALETRIGDNPIEIARLISWMSSNRLSLLALDYVRSLPGDVVAKWPIPRAAAGACVNIADWKELHRRTAHEWDQYEFLRHMYAARACRGENEPGAATREWAAAEKDAGNNIAALKELIRLASEWDWKEETVQLLWDLSKQPGSELEALQRLRETYRRDQDTTGLLRTLRRLVELQPDDAQIACDFARIRLLLETDVDSATQAAARLYAREKTNPDFAATYGFALYRKGNTKGALKVMDALPEEARRQPDRATYYGILLSADGQHGAASTYLQIASLTKLLPEEQRLLRTAREAAR